jgi:prolyl-tRNA editing enzyme YbaK/EbsC (Cys-tRNA(Pro) deacylase)
VVVRCAEPVSTRCVKPPGFAAGGTPPFGHATPLRVFADPALKRNDPVWAAAGTPTTVFPISISDLDRLASPVWVTVT